MATDIEKIAQELRGGLEGVTQGPWCCAFNGTGNLFIVQRGYGEWDDVRISGDFERDEDAEFLSTCSPENIRALLDELSRSREAEKRLRKALEPFAREAEEENGEPRKDWEFDPDNELVSSQFCDLTFGHFRAARSALAKVEGRET